MPAEPFAETAVATAPLTDTFCTYLARQFWARKGFTDAVPPEADALAVLCDQALTRADGYTFRLLLMVDRETYPGKRFTAAPEEVLEVGKACLKYTGSVSGAKMPVVIDVMEVGPEEPGQRERLAAFKRPSIFGKTVPSGWVIDPGAGSVWTSRLQPIGGDRAFIRQLLRSPRESDAELVPMEVASAPDSTPILTYASLAALLAIFAAEILFGIGEWTKLLEPSIATLVAFGGLTRGLVLQSGEWFRLFSAPLLHADATHLLLNAIGLYLGGATLERLVGRAWFGAILVVGALGGSLMSLALNPGNIVSVGASGAIMGLFAALLALALRFPSGGDRTALVMNALYVLIPSMLPLTSSLGGHKVDLGAHLGGALAGGALGLLLLATWPRSEARPRWTREAAAVALIGLAALAYPAWGLARGYDANVLPAGLAPQAEFPQTDDDARARSAALVERYPRDPRVRLLHGVTLATAGDRAGAERELRAGLAEQPTWRTIFTGDLPARLQTVLAVVVAEDKARAGEALAIARPACEAVTTGHLRGVLDDNKLCER